MRKQFLAAVGTISTVVLLALGVVQLYQWYASPSEPKVTAECIPSDFDLPPDVVTAMHEIAEQTGYVSVSKLIEPGLPEEYRRDASRIALAIDVGLQKQRNVLSQAETRYSSMLRCIVRNEGQKPASEVVLQAGASGIAEISGSGGVGPPEMFVDNIDLGSILPNSTVTVTLWTGPRSLWSPVVSHSTGSTEVAVATELFGWKAQLAKNLGLYTLLVLMFAPLALAAYALSRRDSTSKRIGEKTEKSPTEKP